MIEVLKVIGIILLVILALALLLLLCLLLIPFRYKGKAVYHEKLNAEIQIGWFFNLIGLKADYDKKLKCGLIIFGRVRKILYESAGDEKPADKSSENLSKMKQNADKSVSATELSDTDISEKSRELLKASEQNSAGERTEDNQSGTSLTKRLSGIKKIFEDDENKSAVNIVFIHLKKIIKHIFPTEIKGRLEFGFDDPAATGYTLASLALLYPSWEGNVEVIPHFEEKMLDMMLTLKGRLFLIYCLYHVSVVWFNKDFRRLLCQIKSMNY